MRWNLLVMCLVLGACGGRGRPSGPLGTEAACDARDACSARCTDGEILACDHLVARVSHDSDGPRYGASAAAAYQLACDHGSPAGCAAAALLYDRGRGVAVDAAQAQALFARARAGLAAQCRDGFAAGCEGAAELYRHGRGVARDDARARALADDGCRGGSGRGCLRLWRTRAVDGDDDAAGYAAALRYLAADCDGGDRDACQALQHEHDRRAWTTAAPTPAPAPPTRGFDPLAVQCTSDPPDLCDRLPAVLAGLAGDALDGLSAELARDACARGHEPSCYQLGVADLGGLGVAPDVAGGLARIDAACSAGEAAACDAYGQAIASGLVAGQAAAAAIPYQRRACDLDDAAACHRLGHAMFEGIGPFERPMGGVGVPDDVPRGIALLEQACDLGVAAACAELGRIHFNGWHVAADPARGLRLLHLACLIGGQDECESERAYRGQ